MGESGSPGVRGRGGGHTYGSASPSPPPAPRRRSWWCAAASAGAAPGGGEARRRRGGATGPGATRVRRALPGRSTRGAWDERTRERAMGEACRFVSPESRSNIAICASANRIDNTLVKKGTVCLITHPSHGKKGKALISDSACNDMHAREHASTSTHRAAPEPLLPSEKQPRRRTKPLVPDTTLPMYSLRAVLVLTRPRQVHGFTPPFLTHPRSPDAS